MNGALGASCFRIAKAALRIPRNVLLLLLPILPAGNDAVLISMRRAKVCILLSAVALVTSGLRFLLLFSLVSILKTPGQAVA